jgi:hypothetical protein
MEEIASANDYNIQRELVLINNKNIIKESVKDLSTLKQCYLYHSIVIT